MPIPASRPPAHSIAIAADERLRRSLSAHSAWTEREHDQDIYDTRLDPMTGEKLPDGEEQPHVIKVSICSFYRDDLGDVKLRKLGVMWNDLLVHGTERGLKVYENVLLQFNIAQQSRKARQSKNTPARKVILNRVHGCVKPGEMLLVLGRPVSGCTTLLNIMLAYPY